MQKPMTIYANISRVRVTSLNILFNKNRCHSTLRVKWAEKSKHTTRCSQSGNIRDSQALNKNGGFGVVVVVFLVIFSSKGKHVATWKYYYEEFQRQHRTFFECRMKIQLNKTRFQHKLLMLNRYFQSNYSFLSALFFFKHSSSLSLARFKFVLPLVGHTGCHC